MHDIQNKLLATREKVTEINRLKEEIENIWNPLYNDREKLTEEQILQILEETRYYQEGFHIRFREFWRSKFG